MPATEPSTEIVNMYKEELAIAHDRIREHMAKIDELTTMINDVQRVDYIKYRLMQIGGHDRAFRYIVSDVRYKGELEQLFDLPFDEILKAYLAMLNRRNRIVHKWTMSLWEAGPVPGFRARRLRLASMFPNFTSLQQRERKRLELLARVQRNYWRRETQRDMYAEALWASDAEKTLAVSKAAQTDEEEKKSQDNQYVSTNNALIETPPTTVVEPPGLSLVEAIRRMVFIIPPPPPRSLTAEYSTQTDRVAGVDASGQTNRVHTTDSSGQTDPPAHMVNFNMQTDTVSESTLHAIAQQPVPLPTLGSMVSHMPREVGEAFRDTSPPMGLNDYYEAEVDSDVGTDTSVPDESPQWEVDPDVVIAMNAIMAIYMKYPDLSSLHIHPLGEHELPIAEYFFSTNGELVAYSQAAELPIVVSWSLTAELITAICLIRTGFEVGSEAYVDWSALGVHPLFYNGRADPATILGDTGLPHRIATGDMADVNRYDWITMARTLYAIHAAHFDDARSHENSAPLAHEAEIVEEIRQEAAAATPTTTSPEPTTMLEPTISPEPVEAPMQQSETGVRTADDDLDTRQRTRRRLVEAFSPEAPPSRLREREEAEVNAPATDEQETVEERRFQRPRTRGHTESDYSSRAQEQNRKNVLAILQKHDREITASRLIVRPMLWADDLGSDGTPAGGFQIRLHRDGERLMIVKTRGGRENPSVEKNVNWHSTPVALLDGLRTKGITLDSRLQQRVQGRTLTANSERFQSRDTPTLHDSSTAVRSRPTGASEGELTPGLSLSSSAAMQFLSTFYQRIGTDAPTFQVDAVIPGAAGKYRLTTYRAQLRLRQNAGSRSLAPADLSTSPMNKVDWPATQAKLAQVALEFASEDSSSISDASRQQISTFLAVYGEVARQFGISVIRSTIPRELGRTLPAGRGLRGRGLRGAGTRGRPKGSGGAPYSSVQRKGKYYNLNDIQNSGLASAYIYRKLGSKFVRIPDLNSGVLNVCYPSRKKVGPKREISEEVKQMVKDLIYSQSISQDAYDKMSVEDKQLFKEILQVTHIEHVFRDELADPLNTLKMEYDKLKGELLMGNDNPSILRQLKVVTADMYSNRLISDKEFKDIITRLI